MASSNNRVILKVPSKSPEGIWLMKFLFEKFGDRYLHIDRELANLIGDWYPGPDEVPCVSRTVRDNTQPAESDLRDICEFAIHPRALPSVTTALRAAIASNAKEAVTIRQNLVDALKKNPIRGAGQGHRLSVIMNVVYDAGEEEGGPAGGHQPRPRT